MTDRILCVDDEPNVLAGLRRQLRKRFDVDVAEGGEQGLAAVKERGPYAVIVSDMRMPGMDGARFLSRARELAPDSARVLLTGYADQQAAIAAVNEGNIFRFLTKPCPPEALLKVLEAGVEQHRLITAEKELLEKTLRGSIEVLTEVLTLVSPLAFSRATRVRRLVGQLGAVLRVEHTWPLDVAALLSQIGCVAVPDAVLAGACAGKDLPPKEWDMFESHPRIGSHLIGKIPRLEEVAAIIAYQEKRYDGGGRPEDGRRGADIPYGARVLKVALDCDSLESRGHPRSEAIECLKGRSGWYDPDVLRALEKVPRDQVPCRTKEVLIRDLRCRMILAEDVHNATGLLMARKGQEITEFMLHRLQNYRDGGVIGASIKVDVPLDLA